ncbi:hypothetical protein [Lentzea sp. E54]
MTITGHAAADEYADRNGVPGEMVVRVKVDKFSTVPSAWSHRAQSALVKR